MRVRTNQEQKDALMGREVENAREMRERFCESEVCVLHTLTVPIASLGHL